MPRGRGQTGPTGHAKVCLAPGAYTLATASSTPEVAKQPRKGCMRRQDGLVQHVGVGDEQLHARADVGALSLGRVAVVRLQGIVVGGMRSG